MNKSTRLLITAAAMAGLYAGSLATRALAESTDQAGQAAPKDSKDKKASCGAHGCKNQNGCAGKGGCKSGDNGCASKNSCAGKGGCEVKAKTKDSKKDDSKTDDKKNG